MVLPTLPASGSTSWYSHYSALHDAATGSPFVVVASVDAPNSVKESADFECDGTADEVQINAAIDLASPLQSRNSLMAAGAQQRGRVMLTGGRFNIASPIFIRTGVGLFGAGELTEVRAVSVTATTGYPSGSSAMIKQWAVTDHAFTIADMWLNGNFASGGTACHGILLSGPGGNQSEYPNTNPDPSNHIRDIRLSAFTGGTRHAIWLTNNCRGNHFHNIYVRDVVGNGFWADATPDSVLTASTFGGCGTGVRLEGANWRLNGVKTFYCGLNGGTGQGFVIGSGRHSVVNIESQDDQYGVILSGIKNVLSGVNIDCVGTTAFEISGSRNSVMGFSVYQRSGGRFATTTNGLIITGTPTDLQLVGWIEQTNGGTITTPFTGTITGSRNFVRISDDSSGLRSQG